MENKLEIVIGKSGQGKTSYLLKHLKKDTFSALFFSENLEYQEELIQEATSRKVDDCVFVTKSPKLKEINFHIERFNLEGGEYPNTIYIDDVTFLVEWKKDRSFRNSFRETLLELRNIAKQYNCNMVIALEENIRKEDHNRKFEFPCVVTKVKVEDGILYKNSYDNFTGNNLGKCSWDIRRN